MDFYLTIKVGSHSGF